MTATFNPLMFWQEVSSTSLPSLVLESQLSPVDGKVHRVEGSLLWEVMPKLWTLK